MSRSYPDAVFKQVDEMNARLVAAGLGDSVEIIGFTPPHGEGRITKVRISWNGDGDQSDISRRVQETLPWVKEILFRGRATLA